MVKNVRAELDGKWLRFTNDKYRAFIYQFDEKCLGGPHELKISAEDEAGNKTSDVVQFYAVTLHKFNFSYFEMLLHGFGRD